MRVCVQAQREKGSGRAVDGASYSLSLYSTPTLSSPSYLFNFGHPQHVTELTELL